ncbi:MAG TPA: cupin domain-containing protein [Candidatus Angelobacter sp.]|nr:cupin domain-containing protein [Candidatus Angelobacter sp.]
MKVSSGLLVGLIILTFGPFTKGSGDTAGTKYVPFVPLSEDAVVIQGDVEKEGQEFVMRIRELRGGFIPPHTHPVDEHITVLAGNVCLGTGPEFDRARLHCLGQGGYAFFPKGTTIFGESTEPATVQVHGVGPFHLHWKYPLQTFESSDAAQAFRYRAGQKIRTKYGVGTIEKGWRSGPIIQYETRVGRELVMATESEVSLVTDSKLQ